VPSLCGLYPGADFQEREAFDMFGVRFAGHPNLKRILLWDGFAGHPLRKDWREPFYEADLKPFPGRWPDGRFAFVSNYSMYGSGFVEGHDTCSPGGASDSYVYRVSLADLEIDKVIRVGEVPKYLAVTPDQKYLLVSNWCSYTLSVIDVRTSKQVKGVYLGPYPRGIAVAPDSSTAYVAVMGTANIAVVDLTDFSVSWINGVGAGPRHLCMAGNGKYLYATLNNEGNVAKIDPKKKVVVDKVYTGSEPRSMAIAPDGKSLFVVNYNSSTMSQIRTSDMKVIDSVGTNSLPIGITYDAPTKSVWLCCYTGSIMVFKQV
jgi:YVTN family beta-propeller protein